MRTIFHVVTPDDTSLEEMRRVADVVKTAVFDAENGVSSHMMAFALASNLSKALPLIRLCVFLPILCMRQRKNESIS
jgi:hypothetical protein